MDMQARPRLYPDARHRTAMQSTARGLGWFSIALGAAEILFARGLSRSLGMPGSAGWMQACGVREVATGIGILNAKRDASPWLWGRVAGDALDLGALASAVGREGNRHRGAATAALVAVAGVTMLDVAVAQQATSRRRNAARPQPDYSSRAGFPRGVDAVHGIAKGVTLAGGRSTYAATSTGEPLEDGRGRRRQHAALLEEQPRPSEAGVSGFVDR